MGVVCIQETHAPEFPDIPNDQPYRYDGPVGQGGREGGFLFHEAVLVSNIPGVVDSQHIRWRFVFHTICVCSYYAPHAGVDESNRVSFWQDLVASTAHVVSVLPHSTLILSGDANVWHHHFSLDRMRSRDNAIFPYIQQLLDMGLG